MNVDNLLLFFCFFSHSLTHSPHLRRLISSFLSPLAPFIEHFHINPSCCCSSPIINMYTLHRRATTAVERVRGGCGAREHTEWERLIEWMNKITRIMFFIHHHHERRRRCRSCYMEMINENIFHPFSSRSGLLLLYGWRRRSLMMTSIIVNVDVRRKLMSCESDLSQMRPLRPIVQ